MGRPTIAIGTFAFLTCLGAVFALGLVCVAWPYQLQEFARREMNRPLVRALSPFSRWVDSPAYPVAMRIFGATAIAVVVFVVYAWLFLRVPDLP